MEDGRLEDATNEFKAGLRAGGLTSEQEALLRCKLSESYEKRALNREQLEALAKYDNFPDLSRFSERTQMILLTRLGWAHSYNNDIPRAIALFNQAMRIARSLDDQMGIGLCHLGMARCYRFVSEIRIARDHYRTALDGFRRVGSWREIADCYFNIGNIDFREGDFRGAITSIRQALTIIGDRKEYDLLARAYGDLALIHQNLELSGRRAIELWEKSINFLRSANNQVMLAVNYNNLAYQLMITGEWERAEALTREGIEIIRHTPRIAYLGALLDTYAQVLVLRGRITEAEKVLEESLSIFEMLRAKQPISKELPFEPSTQLTIGRCFLARDQAEKALHHFERAVEITTRLGDRQYLADALLWLAEGQLRLGKVEAAKENIAKVKKIMRESQDVMSWGTAMRLEAKAAIAEGQNAMARAALGQSDSIFEIKGSQYELGLNRLARAALHENEGDIAAAIREVNAAISTFDALGATVDAARARKTLAELEAKRSAARPAPRKEGPENALVIDGFTANRIVQAGVSRELLVYELAAVAREYSASRAALVAEIVHDLEVEARRVIRLEPFAALNLGAAEQSERLEMLARLPVESYAANFVYEFGDNQQTSYLLHLIDPRALNFLSGAFSMEPLLRLVEQGLENEALRSKTKRAGGFTPARLLTEVELPGFICASRAMSRVLEQIHKIRSSDVTVLITGESGTGKELIARAVHAGSSRRANTFLPFNCSAAPREMIESQLFGFRKGSFTGAVTSNDGIIRAAEKGTLFLDEIGDLPLDLQPKLLRFLQEGEIHPLGEPHPIQVDVRVVAATNADLEKAVANGRFREDLFHRLNVIRIQVPPLRERREEIPALVNYYLNVYQQESAKRDIQISEEALDLMVVYDWPGNVRQLCNEVRRIIAYADSGTMITPDQLSKDVVRAAREMPPPPPAAARPAEGGGSFNVSPGMTLSAAVEELERRMIQEALRHSSGNIARAAKELGLSRKGLYLKMDRLKFKPAGVTENEE